MSKCRDLSFLNKVLYSSLNKNLQEQIFDSCFPGIKTWLLSYLTDDSHNKLFQIAKNKKTPAQNPYIIFFIDDIIKTYTRYYNTYYIRNDLFKPTNTHISNFNERIRHIDKKWDSQEEDLDTPIINTNIYDRLKLKIKELLDITNSGIINHENKLKIIVKKIYINGIFNTINNLDKYKIGSIVVKANFLEKIYDDYILKYIFSDSSVSDRNQRIIDSEQLEHKYSAPPGKFSGAEKNIIAINTHNQSALIKYKCKKSTSGTVCYKPDTWINLEYLDIKN